MGISPDSLITMSGDLQIERAASRIILKKLMNIAKTFDF